MTGRCADSSVIAGGAGSVPSRERKRPEDSASRDCDTGRETTGGNGGGGAITSSGARRLSGATLSRLAREDSEAATITAKACVGQNIPQAAHAFAVRIAASLSLPTRRESMAPAALSRALGAMAPAALGFPLSVLAKGEITAGACWIASAACATASGVVAGKGRGRMGFRRAVSGPSHGNGTTRSASISATARIAVAMYCAQRFLTTRRIKAIPRASTGATPAPRGLYSLTWLSGQTLATLS